jgi:hypothetical protein
MTLPHLQIDSSSVSAIVLSIQSASVQCTRQSRDQLHLQDAPK